MKTYCPKCGGKLIAKYIESDEIERKVCQACGSVLYENSKPCVGALILNRGMVLLALRSREPFKGYWDIPGGFLEYGEHPAKGVVREILEETGLQIKPTQILGIFMDVYGSEQESTLNICYVCKLLGGKAKAKSDIMEIKWFDLDSLPEKIAFKWSIKALDLLRRKKQHLNICPDE